VGAKPNITEKNKSNGNSHLEIRAILICTPCQDFA
jgi:hypothetical protein